MVQLSQEILEIIIDHLAVQDEDSLATPSLKACSLSSRSLRRRCREHLFSHVVLGYSIRHSAPIAELKRLNDFKAILDQDRGLSRCIKTLELCLAEPILFSRPKSPLPSIITALYSIPTASLRALILRGSRFRPLQWETTPTDLKSALYNLCQSGSLHNLQLHYVERVPLQILWTAHPALQSLTIMNTIFDQLTNDPKHHVGSYGSSAGSHASFHTISVDQSLHNLLAITEKSSRPFKSLLRTLKTFHVEINAENRQLIPGEFLLTLQHLTSLSIFAQTLLKPEEVKLDLASLQFLSRLHLRLAVPTLSYAALALNNAFKFLRSSHGNPNQIESMIMTVEMSRNILDYWDTTVSMSTYRRIEWELLDVALASDMFPKLRRCGIVVQWAGLDDYLGRQGWQTSSTQCEWLQQYFGPPDNIHGAVEVSINFAVRSSTL